MGIDSKAQIAIEKCKFLGNVINNTAHTSFNTYWDQVTPENGGKWGAVEATRDNMNWNNLDMIYDFAQTNNIPFKQHTFIWGNQQPTWIGSLPEDEQLEEIQEWIQSFCQRYPNTEFIEVVNEPINDPPSSPTGDGGGYINALGGAGTTGYDWIINSFEMTREYCPDAKLLINEYNLLNGFTPSHTYLNIINLLKERDLIDGVGLQSHSLEETSATVLKSNLDEIATAGVPIYITEYEVRGDEAEQLSIYKEQFPILWNEKLVQGITLWGYIEGTMWRNEAYLLASNQTSERAALSWLKAWVDDAAGGSFCFDGVTGIDDEQPQSLIYFTNPVIDGKLLWTSTEAIQKFEILDVQGKVVGVKKPSIESRKGSLDLNLPHGVYLLHVHTNHGIITEKIILK